MQMQQLTVIDPLSRKIEVPIGAITETKALHRDGCPSLCLLYMEGRCRQGVECNQIHADPYVVKALREVANSKPSCCQFHGDEKKDLFKNHPEWTGRTLIVDGVVIPLEFAAFTQGLQRSMEGGSHHHGHHGPRPNTNGAPPSTVITPTFVCRLQAGGHCRYAEECKFVHLCREVTQQHLSHCVFPLATDLERKHKSMQQHHHHHNHHNNNHNGPTLVLARPQQQTAAPQIIFNGNAMPPQQQQQHQSQQPQQPVQFVLANPGQQLPPGAAVLQQVGQNFILAPPPQQVKPNGSETELKQHFILQPSTQSSQGVSRTDSPNSQIIAPGNRSGSGTSTPNTAGGPLDTPFFQLTPQAEAPIAAEPAKLSGSWNLAAQPFQPKQQDTPHFHVLQQ